jgi:hypothetical protein
MIDRTDHVQLWSDKGNLAARTAAVAEHAKTAHRATIAGTELFLAICALAEDVQAMSKPNVDRSWDKYLSVLLSMWSLY